MKPPVLDSVNLTEETYERYEQNDFMDTGHIGAYTMFTMTRK